MNRMPLDHARHNKCVFDHLYQLQNQPYKDWIVTTAFYTSIHFVDSKIFPFQHHGKDIKSIDSAFGHADLKRANRHNTRFDLVCTRLPEVRSEFKYLMDKCHNARYVNYKVSKGVIDVANQFLDKIIQTCNP